MRNDFESEYLAHHGILGMKWGHRNGPPYPLDASEHSSSEKKAGYEKSIKNNSNNTASDSNKLTSDQRKMIRNAAIASVAAVGIGVGMYYAKKYGNMNLDKVIKSGTNIQHMSRKTTELLNKPFYASYLKADNKKYSANDFFGVKWNSKIMANATKDLKIAGKKNAERIYTEWINTNKEAAKRFGNQSYFSFNKNLNSPDMYDKELFSSFFEKLVNEGYDAIHDVNDQHQSGVIAPLIIFGSLKDIKISDIQKLK